MAKMITWTDEEAKKELSKRLSYGLDIKNRLQRDWNEAETTLFNTRANGVANELNVTFDSAAGLGTNEIDQGNTDYSVNYVYKNFRYICSQLAANPPAVIARPQTSDLADRRKADAADRLVRYLRTQYKLQEVFELGINNCQAYGTGITKTIWDSDGGDPIDYDEESGEIVMTGDFSITNISPWDFVIDPDANTWDEVKYVFERVMIVNIIVRNMLDAGFKLLPKTVLCIHPNRLRRRTLLEWSFPVQVWRSFVAFTSMMVGLGSYAVAAEHNLVFIRGMTIVAAVVKANLGFKDHTVQIGDHVLLLVRGFLNPFHIGISFSHPFEIFGLGESIVCLSNILPF
jgi:hypothetical protein